MSLTPKLILGPPTQQKKKIMSSSKCTVHVTFQWTSSDGSVPVLDHRSVGKLRRGDEFCDLSDVLPVFLAVSARHHRGGVAVPLFRRPPQSFQPCGRTDPVYRLWCR